MSEEKSKASSGQMRDQIDSILSGLGLGVGVGSMDLDCLELCEASIGYPWRTIRSRVNGARLCIEQNGEWKRPTYAMQSEATLADHPRWTDDELWEKETSDGFPFA